MYRPVAVILTVTSALVPALASTACSKGDATPSDHAAGAATTTTPTINGSDRAAQGSAGGAVAPELAPPATSTPAALAGGTSGGTSTPAAGASSRPPNKLGRIPILEYHLIEDREWRWGRNYERFRQDLEELYNHGYRPVTVSQILDKKIDLPRGLSPVVVVFDDASPGQFSYIERNGTLEVDPKSGMGIWLAMHQKHPDWTNSAVFCVLPAAAAGHAFFGEKGIDGQKTAWRFPKLQFLAKNGFEICNHTLWHANLGKYSDAFVQEQIARGQLAIDSAVPGYKVRTFALPLGVWPKNKSLAWQGAWTNPKTGQTTRYHYEAVLEVAGGPTRSPYDPHYDPHHMMRVELFGNELEKALTALDRPGPNGRYVSDGNPKTVARP